MEATDGECPTDILIDITVDVLPSFTNDKESNVFDIFKSKVCLEEKENTLLQIKEENYPSILDVSPCRIIDEFDFGQNKELDTIVEQSAESKEVVNDCPTGILIDVPHSLNSASKPNTEFNSSEYRSRKYDKQNTATQELKDKLHADSSKDDFRRDFIDASPSIDERNDQLLHRRKRWNTPSPQSMSRISKEASKVINNLNSSEIFDEDLLLIEEELPIPINFDNFDLEDNTDQNEKASFESEMLKLSISIDPQSSQLNSEKKEKEAVDYASLPMLKENIKSTQPQSKMINSKDYNTSDSNSYSLSSAINSDSLDSSKVSTANDSIDDVFMEKSISSEDKENMQRRETNNKNAKLNAETPSKSLLKSGSKLQFRATLRNLSNIVSDSTDSEKSPISKSIIPQRRMSLAPKLKLTPSSVGKLQIKKTAKEVESRNFSKISTGSNSFLLPSTKQIGMQKPGSTKKNTSSFPAAKQKSSSLDIKQTNGFSTMKTPSKRYSVSTPLKSASVSKPSLTPASHKNPPARYTPQSVQTSRLSFSKSLQQPLSVSRTSIYKGPREQNFTPLAGSLSFKASSGIQNTFNNQKRQSFSQSMSAASFRSLGKTCMSTTSNGRFCSKLNPPTSLHTEQERKLARNLFPSTGK